jgi:hypothetical protein
MSGRSGTADTRMTEKHYAHLSPNYVADTIRANFPKLGIAEVHIVVPLRVGGQASGNQNPPLLHHRG